MGRPTCHFVVVPDTADQQGVSVRLCVGWPHERCSADHSQGKQHQKNKQRKRQRTEKHLSC